MLEPILRGSSVLAESFNHLSRNAERSGMGRIALANQVTRSDDERWISIVNVIILALTILGSGMILISMSYYEFIRLRPTTTRTRIVQALIVSDFILGIIGLISSSVALSGDGSGFAHGSTSCDGLGFMLVTILWTEHGWTLILAVATFMILIYPLHWFTLMLEQRWYFLWAIVWVIAISVAIIGYEVFGYYPSGGLCFYGSNAGLYSELMQFVPRCVVCIIITVLYAKLYVFLKRPDKIRLPGSNSATGGQYETVSSTSNKEKVVELKGKLGNFMTGGKLKTKRGSSGEVLSPLPQQQQHSTSSSTTDSSSARQPVDVNTNEIRQSSNTLSPGFIPKRDSNGSQGNEKEPMRKSSLLRRPSFSPIREIPPWEKLELPAFQVDGERFGGPSSSSTRSPSIWSGWKGLGQRKRSSTTTSGSTNNNLVSPASRMNSINSIKHQNQTQNQNNPPSLAEPISGTLHTSNSNSNLKITPPGSYVPRMPSIPSEDIVATPQSTKKPSSLQPLASSIQHQRNSTDETYVAQPTASGSGGLNANVEKKRKKSVQLSLSPRSHPGSNASSPEIGYSPKLDARQRPSVTISEGILHEDDQSQPQSQSHSTAHKRQHPPSISLPPRPGNPWSNGGKSEPSTPTPFQQNFQFSVTPTSNRNTFMSEKQTNIIDKAEHGQAPEDGEDDGEDDEWDLARMLAQPPPGTHSTDDRFAPNPSQSQANSEAFELVPESMSSYLNRKTALLMLWFPLGYLFLFSVSLIRLIYDFAGTPPPALRAISKWMILAQGVLDAIIYGVVEWHTKRVVRKRVRKGTLPSRGGGQRNTPTNSKLGTVGFLKNISTKLSASATGSNHRHDNKGTTSRNGSLQRFDPTTSISMNHGTGTHSMNQVSSYFIPEEHTLDPIQQSPQLSNQTQTQPQPQKDKSGPNLATGKGTWNHEFSMGSINENELNTINSPIVVQQERKGSESPLGGPGPGQGQSEVEKINPLEGHQTA
ncbi:uncharacterized protein L201_001671 [Kwoniella dendrophila CBS 6074]|uniref:G-protein coupled receptors family 1 profile domain-containing protein n=1 Tax=Kwoniella dendrophila CBS 6074 TaxID=1295534 RepID=A0AAX4JN40_9TREE